MQNPLRTSKTNNIRLVKSALFRVGAKPRRRLGQSFLVDPRGLKIFFDAVASVGDRVWMEIGPGPGLLSCSLSGAVDLLVAVEIDRLLAKVAAGFCREVSNVAIVVSDGLRMASLWRGSIVSNTPYNISSKLLSVITKNNYVINAVLGVQHEVALRILSSPGTKGYGRLTILARNFFRVRSVGVLRREWFYPVPKVNGHVLLLTRKREWSERYSGFEEFTACMFSQRNKLARKVFRQCLGVDVGELGDVRVRDIPPERFLEVFVSWREGLL